MISDILPDEELLHDHEQQPRSVLIIDDDVDQAVVLQHHLRRLGFETTAAHRGSTGLASALESPPDLVVLDLRLPDMDGLTICAQLGDAPQTSTIPVIIVSGMEGPALVRQVRAAGARFFLRKPYDPNVLLTLIDSAM